MQRTAFFIAGAILIAGCAKGPEEFDQKPYSPSPSGKIKKAPAPPVTSDTDAKKKLREQFKAFAIRKRDYAKRVVVEQNIKPPPLIWEFYQSAIDGGLLKPKKSLLNWENNMAEVKMKRSFLPRFNIPFPQPWR